MEQNTPLPFYDKAIEILRRYCNTHYGGNARAFSAFLGIDPNSGVVSRWLRGGGSGPTLQKIGPVMDKMGVTLLDPSDPVANRSAEARVEEMKRALDNLQAELEQSKLLISQLTGERNAFRDMALTLTQHPNPATAPGGIKNTNINKNF